MAMAKDDDRLTIPVPDHPVTGWRRFPHWPLIDPANRPKSRDIVQGQLGNCWILSALALIVERPELLCQILATEPDEFLRTRHAKIRLFWHGKWETIMVDDWLPCDSRGRLVFSTDRRRQLFVPLVEKAIAKLYGGYGRLMGGHISQAMTLLTGFPCQILPLRPNDDDGDAAATDDDRQFECWLQILSFNSARYLQSVACGSFHGRGKSDDRLGLLPDHAYSVLDVISIPGHRLIRLRDPWGTTVWRGEWCHQLTPQLRRKLATDAEQHGIFWISYDDLCRYFEEVVVCKILNSPYYQYDFDGSFPIVLNLNDESHGTVFELTLLDSGRAQIMATLFQRPDDDDQNRTTKTNIFLVIFQLLPSKHSQVLGKFIAGTAFGPYASVNCEAELCSRQRYLIAAISFEHKALTILRYRNFVLQFYSTKTLWIEDRRPNPALIGDILIAMARMFGKPYHRRNRHPERDAWLTTYHLSKNFPGVVTVVENHHPERWLSVTMQTTPWLRSSKRLLSSRAAFQTVDLIAPGHVQLVAVLAESAPDVADDPSPPHISVRMSFKWCQAAAVEAITLHHEPSIFECYGMHSPRPMLPMMGPSVPSSIY